MGVVNETTEALIGAHFQTILSAFWVFGHQLTTPVKSTSIIAIDETAIITRPTDKPPCGFSGIIKSQRCNFFIAIKKGISFALVPNREAISSLNTKRRPVKHKILMKIPSGKAKKRWTFKQKFLITSNSFWSLLDFLQTTIRLCLYVKGYLLKTLLLYICKKTKGFFLQVGAKIAII